MSAKQSHKVKYTAVFEPHEQGGYTVTVPALKGCVTEGLDLNEARLMARDAIEGYIESLQKDNEPIPDDVPVTTSLYNEIISVDLVAV